MLIVLLYFHLEYNFIFSSCHGNSKWKQESHILLMLMWGQSHTCKKPIAFKIEVSEVFCLVPVCSQCSFYRKSFPAYSHLWVSLSSFGNPFMIFCLIIVQFSVFWCFTFCSDMNHYTVPVFQSSHSQKAVSILTLVSPGPIPVITFPPSWYLYSFWKLLLFSRCLKFSRFYFSLLLFWTQFLLWSFVFQN